MPSIGSVAVEVDDQLEAGDPGAGGVRELQAGSPVEASGVAVSTYSATLSVEVAPSVQTRSPVPTTS